jgi:hypothetical protein
VFLDESGVTTHMTRLWGRALRGERVPEAAPAGHWQTLTLLGAMTVGGLVATMTIESPTDGDVFLAYLEQVLCPVLQPGQGHKLFSVQSIAVSMAFSQVSLFTEGIFFGAAQPLSRILCALLLFVLGSLPAFATPDRSALRVLRPILDKKFYDFGLMILVVCLLILFARNYILLGFAIFVLRYPFDEGIVGEGVQEEQCAECAQQLRVLD